MKERTVLISFAVNLFLVVNKLIFAVMSNTTLIFLDAVHSLVDSLASLLAYASIRISGIDSKDKSKLYGQAENLASIIISFIILFGAYEVFKRALEPKLMFGTAVPNFPLAIIGTLISIGVLYFISRYMIHIGTKTNSPALVAEGSDHWMDLYSSIAVLISLFSSLVGISLNKIAGVVIAILIAKLGLEILSRSVKSFLKGLYSDMEDAQAMETTGASKIDMRRYLSRLKNIWKYALAIIIVLYLLSGIYVVESDEEGILKRFGREVESKIEPGLHYHLPWPVETVMKTKVTKVNRLEFGFRFETQPYEGGIEPELWESIHGTGSYRKVTEESLMVSGDENIVDLNLIVQYRIRDSSRYLFNTREPHRIIKDVVEASIRQVVGSKTIDEALTGGKLDIQSDVESIAQETLDLYYSGLEILAVQLQDVHPPTDVAEAFKDVASAREDKNRIINDANAYQNDVLPKARGNAEKIIQDAEAYKAQRVNTAKGDVERFMKVYEQYVNHKNTTKTRLYLETMEEVLPNTKIFVVDSSATAGRSMDYSTLMVFRELGSQSNVGESSSEAGGEGGLEEEYSDWGAGGYYPDEEELLKKNEWGPTFW